MPASLPPPDEEGPVGSVEIERGAAYANTSTVSIAHSARDAGAVTHIRLSNDGRSWGPWMPDTASTTWSLADPGAVGTHTVYTQWRDEHGNISTTASDSIVLDPVRPTLRDLRVTLPRSGQMGIRTAPLSLRYRSADGLSGVSNVQVQRRRTDGAWTTLRSDLGASGGRVVLAPGSHVLRLRALDHAGNRSAWTQTADFRLAILEESNPRMSFDDSWVTKASMDHSGGAAVLTSTAAAGAAGFASTSFAVVVAVGPSHARLNVGVDGQWTLAEQFAPAAGHRRIVAARNFSSQAWRRVKLRARPWEGRSIVIVDAIIALSF